MDDQSGWTCDANEAVQISIVQPGDNSKLKTASVFYPKFTYSIFGDEETIFGYKNLSIQLQFAAHDLRSNVRISYDERFKPVENIEAADLNKALKEFLPEASFAPSEEFEQSLLNDRSAKEFKPPGNLVHSYTNDERNYEIWAGSLSDPEVGALLDRMQIFAPLFIEAGTPIKTDDPEWTLTRWTVYFLYEKVTRPTADASPYSLVGYATTYKWFFFKPSGEKHQVSDAEFPFTAPLKISELPSRLRICQFLILPPHQLAGHGSQLYHAIHRDCLKDPAVSELCVENPNEAFDALRDTEDYHILEPEFTKHNITINPDPCPPEQTGGRRRHPRLVPTSRLLPTNTLKEIRSKFKIASSQFNRLVEIYLLSRIPLSHRGSQNPNMARLIIQKSRAENEHDRRYYWWRMLVKQGLYKLHRDLLIQVEREERLQKLDETLSRVEEGYEILLKAFEVRAVKRSGMANRLAEIVEGKGRHIDVEGAGEGENVARVRPKRKFVVDDDDDDDGKGERFETIGSEETNGGAKKAKTS